MKKLFIIILLSFSLASAQESSSFTATSAHTVSVVAPQAQRIDPCKDGGCDFGKKKRRRKGSFGNKRRQKALSSFGKGSNKRSSDSKIAGSGGNGSKRYSKRRGVRTTKFRAPRIRKNF